MSGNCPECNEFIGRKSACECGFKRQQSSNRTDHQCAWENRSSGWRCRMTGTVSLNTSGKPPWYCTWHSQSLRDPEWAEDYQQFLGWRESLMREYPRTDWLPVDKAWWAMTGKAIQGRIAV